MPIPLFDIRVVVQCTPPSVIQPTPSHSSVLRVQPRIVKTKLFGSDRLMKGRGSDTRKECGPVPTPLFVLLYISSTYHFISPTLNQLMPVLRSEVFT